MRRIRSEGKDAQWPQHLACIGTGRLLVHCNKSSWQLTTEQIIFNASSSENTESPIWVGFCQLSHLFKILNFQSRLLLWAGFQALSVGGSLFGTFGLLAKCFNLFVKRRRVPSWRAFLLTPSQKELAPPPASLPQSGNLVVLGDNAVREKVFVHSRLQERRDSSSKCNRENTCHKDPSFFAH